MAKFSATARTSAVCTSLRGPSLYAIANVDTIRVVEVGVFNTTATETRVGLRAWTAAGTQGADITESEWQRGATAQATAKNTHTADATGGDIYREAVLGAAIGSGVIWTFGPYGILIPAGTANGIGLFLPGGTAQHLDFYFDWEE